MDTDETRGALNARAMALYSVASVGAGFFYAFNNAVLPLLLRGANPLLVNLLSNTRSIEGAVIQPAVGAWSDRVWTRFGRRRVFMLAAIPPCALLMALTGLASGLAPTVAAIVLFSLLFNVAADPYAALQADIAPPGQRPALNAVATVVQFGGQVGLGLALALGPFGGRIPALVYPVVAAVILLSFLITALSVREERGAVRAETRHGPRDYAAALRGNRCASRFLVALFLYNVGINTIQVNLTRYATHVLGVSDSAAVGLFVVIILATGLLAAPAAWLAGRIGLKTVIVGGMALIAVAAACALVVRTPGQALPVMILAGAGNACLTLTWPLLTLLVPAEQVGVYAGLKTSAESVSALFSGVLAAALVAGWGYRSIFAVLLVAVVASLITLLPLRVDTPADGGNDETGCTLK